MVIAARWAVRTGVALATLLLASGTTMAQGGPPTIYFGLIDGPGDMPAVRFVFSDPAQRGRFAPVFGYAIRPEGGDCNAIKDEDLRLPGAYRETPLFDPTDPDMTVPPKGLPTFFAVVVSAELVRAGHGADRDRVGAYHTCTRLLFEQIMQVRN